MRVTLERRQKTKGLFAKTTLHLLYALVEFTEEEKYIINTAGLMDTEFYRALAPTGEEVPVPIKHLFGKWIGKEKDGSVVMLGACTLADVDETEQRVRKAFEDLKARIEHHSNSRKAKDTFEL